MTKLMPEVVKKILIRKGIILVCPERWPSAFNERTWLPCLEQNTACLCEWLGHVIPNSRTTWQECLIPLCREHLILPRCDKVTECLHTCTIDFQDISINRLTTLIDCHPFGLLENGAVMQRTQWLMCTTGLKNRRRWVSVAVNAVSQCEYLRNAVPLAKDSSFKFQLTFLRL